RCTGLVLWACFVCGLGGREWRQGSKSASHETNCNVRRCCRQTFVRVAKHPETRAILRVVRVSAGVLRIFPPWLNFASSDQPSVFRVNLKPTGKPRHPRPGLWRPNLLQRPELP